MKTSLVLGLILAFSARADDAPFNPFKAIPLKAGEPAPEDGDFLRTVDALALRAHCQQADMENTDLRKALTTPEPGGPGTGAAIVMGGAAVAVGLGFLVGFLVFGLNK